MPRSHRLDFPGARHHVMNRVTDRQDLFTDDATCALFLDTLDQVPRLFGARIHGYALMPNHYHLMVEVPRSNISEVMQYVSGSFTQAYNRAHGRDGPLFRGRFRNAVVTDDAYWMHLLAYLHLNPVRAHLANKPEDCLWTSHQAYLDAKLAPQWLTTDELVGMFGGRQQLAEYVDAVQRKRRGAPEGFDPDHFFAASRTTEAPEPPPEPVKRSYEEALQDVAGVLGVDVSEVTSLPRGRSANVPAWLGVWWVLRSTGMSQTALGKRMGVSRTRVSQLRGKLHRLAKEDEAVAKAMAKLEDQLAKV